MNRLDPTLPADPFQIPITQDQLICANYDDELYFLTDDETIEVPLIASDSVKKQAAKARPQYPGLTIPPPAEWPLPREHDQAPLSALGISLVPRRCDLANPSLGSPPSKARSRATTPSLDGSMTSEESPPLSCPSTPEGYTASPVQNDWEIPSQLNPDAYALLCQLAADSQRSPDGEGISESLTVPPEAYREMFEVVRESANLTHRRTLAGGELSIPSGDEPVSALSIPSPATFFGSLPPLARQTWAGDRNKTSPSTGTAERFYQLPWRNTSPEGITEGRGNDQQPIRPRHTRTESHLTNIEGLEVTEIIPGAMCDADVTLERTRRWLYSQFVWTTNLSLGVTTETPQACFSPETSAPSTPKSKASPRPVADTSLSRKKSVRFLSSVPEVQEPEPDKDSGKADPIFLAGFQYATTRFKSRDAFRHSQARVEASHMFSSTSPTRHSARLMGDFTVKTRERTPSPTPGSRTAPASPEEEELKGNIASAERERQALDQLMPAVWELQASRQVFGSQLMLYPIATELKSRPSVRILDFGGGASCDWGWAVALKYPNSSVVTMPSSPTRISFPISGPSNHHTVRTSTWTTLPFPDGHFDLISARSMHTMLRTHSVHQEDEYDLVLREFHRVLAPGGYLEFQLMDAEMLHPGPLARELGAEFAARLRERHFDPQASRYFLPRLRNAGFEGVRRTWMVLPAADVVPRWVDRGKRSALGRRDSAVPVTMKEELRGSTGDVRAMTGLVGARQWERWMVSLQREIGGEEEGVLERVNRALEESGRCGAGWKCLVGWARKDGGR